MYFNYDQAKINDLGGGISRRVLAQSANLMICELTFEEGATGTLHNHPHEQITYIMEGEFRFTVGTNEYLCHAGDSLYKAPNIEHGCVCLKKGKILDAFTPRREDFLDGKY